RLSEALDMFPDGGDVGEGRPPTQSRSNREIREQQQRPDHCEQSALRPRCGINATAVGKMAADDRVIDADQTSKRTNSQDDRQRRKSRGNKCETNYVRFARAPIAIKQCGGTFPIQITRPMYPCTRV